MDKSSTIVTTIDRAQLDRDLTPILAELITLEPGNKQHPTVRQLFNWLADPQRTGEEYTYVLGELAERVSSVMEEHFSDFMRDGMDFPYLCVTAAEALAVRCPILMGSWEEATWTLISTTLRIHLDDPTVLRASEQLTAWIIHVIVDPDICPNSSLRLEMLELLKTMVNVNECNISEVIEAVMYVCSYISIDLLSVSTLEDITGYLARLKMDEQILEYDKKLAEKLLDMKSLKVSSMLNDFSYITAVNCQKQEPIELYGLETLLKSVGRLIIDISKENLEEEYDTGSSWFYIRSVTVSLLIIISSFKLSCQTPQLIEITSSCIMDIIESVFLANEDYSDNVCVDKILELLETFLDENLDDLNPLPRMPIRFDVIKKHLRSSTWNLKDCYIFLFKIRCQEYIALHN